VVGKAKSRKQISTKERWIDSGWPQKTFAADESSLGGKKKRGQKEVVSDLSPIDFASQPLASSAG